LTFYDVPGKSKGKISHSVYVNSILELVVKPWITQKDFEIEEDGNSGLGHSGYSSQKKDVVQI